MSVAVTFSTAAAPIKPPGYSSAENVLSQDPQVVNVQKTLQGHHFKRFKTVTKATQYIFEPTENLFQTAEAVITMVSSEQADNNEYANVYVPIFYNRKTGRYSAGKVTVKYLEKSWLIMAVLLTAFLPQFLKYLA